MKIFVQKPGQKETTSYSLQKVKTELLAGGIREDDLAWCEGMGEWAPLRQVLALAETVPQLILPADVLKRQARLTTAELAAQCFKLATSFEHSYTTMLQNLQQRDAQNNVDLGRVWIELICLGAFVVNYALFSALKHGPRNEVLSLYRDQLKQISIAGVGDSYKTLSTRIYFYSLVVRRNAASPQDLPRQIGKRFAAFCGAEDSKSLIRIGIEVFEQVHEYVAQWIAEIGADNIVAAEASDEVA